jgi:glycosyltransferase 2 family protein
MSQILKRILHWTGSILALLGIVFVALRMRNYSAELDFSRFNTTMWSVCVGLALIYGLANLMLAVAWRDLLEHFSVHVLRRWAIKIYGISQLAKYVPGNIFHLAGRQALGMAAGLPARALAKSALWELGLIAVAGGLFAILAAPLMWTKLSILISVEIFGVMSVGVVIALRQLLSTSVGMALIWQILFLALSGFVFIGVLELVTPTSFTYSTYSLLCGAYVIAWFAGLVTPGAPAGVGVRELILLFLLKGMVAEADLLLAVVLWRLVTVTGDLFYFGLSGFIKTASVGVNPKCD